MNYTKAQILPKISKSLYRLTSMLLLMPLVPCNRIYDIMYIVAFVQPFSFSHKPPNDENIKNEKKMFRLMIYSYIT